MQGSVYVLMKDNKPYFAGKYKYEILVAYDKLTPDEQSITIPFYAGRTGLLVEKSIEWLLET